MGDAQFTAERLLSILDCDAQQIAEQRSIYSAIITQTADIAKKNGNSIDFWFVDANSDGQYDAGEKKVIGNKLDLSGDATSGINKDVTLAEHEDLSVAGATVKCVAELSASGLTDGVQYSAKLAFPDGTTTINAAAAVTAADGAATFHFGMTDAQKKALTAGEYTFTVSDAINGVRATKKVELVTVTLSNGAGYGSFKADDVTTFVVNKGATVAYNDLAKPTAATGSWTADGYTNGTTTIKTGESIEITKDTTLSAVYTNPQVSAAAFTASTFSEGKGTLNVSAKYLPALTNGHYQITVSGPNGFSKTITKTGAEDSTMFTNDNINDVSVTFGADYDSYAATSAKLAAGTYTVSIAPVANEGKTLSADEKAISVATKSITLAAVDYDLGAGSWKSDDTTKTAVRNLKTLIVEGTALKSVANDLTSLLNGAYVEATDELQAIDTSKTTVDGVVASKLDKEEAAAAGVKVAVAYKASYIAAPEVTFAANGTSKFDMTVKAANGTRAYYKTTGMSKFVAVPDSGVVTLTSTNTSVEVCSVTTNTTGTTSSSKTVSYVATAAKAADVYNYATAVAQMETSASAKNAPVRYGDTLKTLAADAKAAVAGLGYATQKDLNAAVLAQYVSIAEKAADVETTNVEAKKGIVKAADGTYTFLSDAACEAAIVNIKKAVAAVTSNNNYKANGTDLDTSDDVAKVNDTAVAVIGSADTMKAYVTAGQKAVEAAGATAVAAADAEAAIAVNEAIAKVPAEITAANAKEAKAAAEAAVKAYNSLNATQQKLISSADYAKAVTAITAADEAVATADKAAVAKVKGKTVKAKASKKTTAKLTKVTSESGAVSTFKKTSGNAKITVSKSGKVTVKKGLKKGKKYTAKVKATIGASTKTVKVVVKVAK